MDLVTCPNCRFAFSPTPGKAVKCPSCMTILSASGKAVAVKAGAPAQKGKPEPQRRPTAKQPPPKNYTGVMLIVAGVLVVVLVGGLVISNVMSSAKSGKKTPAIAAAKPGNALPEVIVPKNTPAPTPPSIEDPDPTPVNPLPTVKPKPSKVRPIDPSEVPPVVVQQPKFPVKPQVIVREVPGVTPESLNGAVAKGVKYLSGTTPQWFNDGSFRLGYIALGGLTLLECKSPRDEQIVKQAAELTRKLAVEHDRTYEITLAIMFLDRLGDPRDRKLIQLLGARLVAGQEASGGYSYSCPILTVNESNQLIAFLDRTRPRKAPAPLALDIGEKTIEKTDPSKSNDGGLDPFAKPSFDVPSETLPAPGVDAAVPPVALPDGDGLVSQPPTIRPKNRLSNTVGTIRLEAKGGGGNAKGMLSARLQTIPAVVNQGRDKDQMVLVFPERPQTDHSNLQFAIVGMYVARRHGVVSDRAIMLAEMRMRKLQMAEGGWTYAVDSNQHPEAMVCAGILSLALGHAVHQSSSLGMSQALVTDKQLVHATKRLGETIKDPQPDIAQATATASTYLLWSVERVAVLYNSPTIEGKDWYGWGAQMLIRNQDAANGSWNMGGFAGASPHVDTCFALLFLVRSNLVHEVSSQHIPLQTPLPEKGTP